MQIMWLREPCGSVKSLNLSKRDVSLFCTCVIVSLILTGAILHHVGFQLAVSISPNWVKEMVGIVTINEQIRIEHSYRQQLSQLKSQISTVESQVKHLESLKNRFAQLADPYDPKTKRSTIKAESQGQGGPYIPLSQETLSLNTLKMSPGETSLLFEEHVSSVRFKMQQLEESLSQLKERWQNEANRLAHIPSGPPLRTLKVTSRFGHRVDPITKRKAMHEGIDFSAPYNTPIYATAAGKVIKATYTRGYGHLVEINHGNGYSTRYAHAKTLLVSKGEAVKRGQHIAAVGSTGRSTGPHLHYEIRYNKKSYNPENWLFKKNSK